MSEADEKAAKEKAEAEAKAKEAADKAEADAKAKADAETLAAEDRAKAAAEKAAADAKAAEEREAAKKAAADAKAQDAGKKAEQDAAQKVSRERQLAALRAMAGHAYGLYKQPDGGYGVESAEHDKADVEALIEAGLAWADATGGNHGSAKITGKGRQVLQELGR